MGQIPKKQIAVLLAEDNASFRKSLKTLLETAGDIHVAGEAKDGLEAVQMAGALKPDVMVMDIAMPCLNGLQATEKILALDPGIKILILSAHPDPEYIHRAMNMGASGYLMKQSSTEYLAQAIREVIKKHTYFSSAIPKGLRSECQDVFDRMERSKKNAA